MDDVDAVQAQIARNMLESGDWVTARLDGVAYLEKSPLIYWIMACSYSLFGVHDWAARLPLALIDILLCWTTARFAKWAVGSRTGLLAGVILATSIGLFLFTRILIPDAALTLAITVAIWAFLRLKEGHEPRPLLWFCALYMSLAAGLLLKGLVALLFPVCIMLIALIAARDSANKHSLRDLHLGWGLLLLTIIAAPWHILATLRNPPLLTWSFVSRAGSYHGFFWFYFFNEHLLRFLNLRYPRDYNTVPRVWFWLLHLVWLFPWSVTLFSIPGLRSHPTERGRQVHLVLLIWSLFVLVFFTLSTTQEYYSLPIYPALAMLLASGLAHRELFPRAPRLVLSGIFCVSLGASLSLLALTAKLPTPGDISAALSQNPSLYTLSMGHIGDLTLRSFAYLRLPLSVAAAAVLLGLAGTIFTRSTKAVVCTLVLVMVILFQAARFALIRFDPYLGSKPLADALLTAGPGTLVEGDAYYAFSSVFFYTDRTALLWNGRINNLEYGSNAPNAPHVFIGDAQLKQMWKAGSRVYLLVYGSDLPAVRKLLGPQIVVLASCGGNYLLSNRRA